MEVTQAIQGPIPLADPTHPTAPVTWSGAATLHAGSRTVVRVFANAASYLAVPNVRATLEGFHQAASGAGAPLPGPTLLLPANTSLSLAPGPAGAISDAKRADPNGGFVFTLPAAWVAAPGDIVLRATVNPSSLSPSITECASCRANDVMTLVHVHLAAPFDPVTIAPVEIEYIDPRTGTGTCARPSFGAICIRPTDPASAFAGARSIVPLPVGALRVLPYGGRIVDVSDIARRDYSQNRNPYNDRRSDVFNRVAGYNWDHNVGGAVTIGVHAGGQPGPQWDGQAVGDFGGLETPVMYFGLRIDPVAIVDAGRPLASVGHEFLHSRGYLHAGTQCDGRTRTSRGRPTSAATSTASA